MCVCECIQKFISVYMYIKTFASVYIIIYNSNICILYIFVYVNESEIYIYILLTIHT